MGFRRTAYAGPETGVRDRASYVVEQGDIRLVLTSGLRGGQRGHAVRVPPRRRREGHRAPGAERERRLPHGGAARRARHRRAALGRRRVRPRRAGRDRHLRRGRPHVREPQRVRGAVPARLRLDGRERPRAGRRRAEGARPRRRQRRARPHGRLGRVLRARLRDDQHRPLRRRPDPDRVLGAHVEGDVGRQREDQVPDQRAGRGQAQEPDRGVPRVQPRPGRAAHRAADARTSSAR